MNRSAESELAFLGIEEAANLLRRKKISPVELVEASLAWIERLNPTFNAFVTVTSEQARRQARAAEKKFLRPDRVREASPLLGIPVSLKDNFYTRGIRTTAGSRILADFVPRSDCSVAARLASAGAILLGKSNLHEFAYGITNENPHYGPVRNPWNPAHMTGGSSGGSAAALATGMGLGATGTDTGGSIRIPAGLCGVVGLKPTFDLVSVEGIVPLAKSLDHAGPMARRVADVCILLEVMAGQYPKGAARPDFRKLRKNRPKRFRLGWPKHYFFERLNEEVGRVVEGAAKSFEELGARIDEVPFAHLAGAAEPSTNMAMAEATHFHESQNWFPGRGREYGEDVRKRLELGREVRAIDYLRAFDVQRQATQEFDSVLQKVDAILAPTLPVAAPRLGEKEVENGGEKETVRSAFVRLNRPANFTGHPAISIPCGFTRDGLPIGLQIIGRRWGEAGLLAIALAYEEANPWHERHPNVA